MVTLEISGTGFLWVICPSSHPTNGVKTLKGTQSNDTNQWLGLTPSSSTTEQGMGAAPFTSALYHQYLILPCNYYYYYYIRLAAFFQDNLGKPAPER